MKSTHFVLENPIYRSKLNDSGYEESLVEFKVATLPAYSFTNHSIDGVNMNVDGITTPISSAIVNDRVIIPGVNKLINMLRPSTPVLTVYHFGIKDYSLLFPEIMDSALKTRVGLFMEEADKTFEQEAWLSFVVMAGSVFEGVLSNLIADYGSTFGTLVNKVSELKILDEYEISILKDAVKFRNHVHAGKFKEETAARQDAMNIRVQLDQFIKKDWNEVKNSLENCAVSRLI